MNKMTLRNEEEAIQSEIYFLSTGKHRVILRDLDTDNVLPVVRIFDGFEAALEYARNLVGVKPPVKS